MSQYKKAPGRKTAQKAMITNIAFWSKVSGSLRGRSRFGTAHVMPGCPLAIHAFGALDGVDLEAPIVNQMRADSPISVDRRNDTREAAC